MEICAEGQRLFELKMPYHSSLEQKLPHTFDIDVTLGISRNSLAPSSHKHAFVFAGRKSILLKLPRIGTHSWPQLADCRPGRLCRTHAKAMSTRWKPRDRNRMSENKNIKSDRSSHSENEHRRITVSLLMTLAIPRDNHIYMLAAVSLSWNASLTLANTTGKHNQVLGFLFYW